jgi:serine/threonine protein phosphatase PrpC
MERLMRGTAISGTESWGGDAGFCSYFALVRKGHEECGDSAFFYHDGKKAIFGVFDGVSGEAGASSASSDAAEIILGSLKGHDRISETKMKQALSAAQAKVGPGLTTALVVYLQKNGSFIAASVGDSPLYSLDKAGEVALEIPLARIVKDGDSILKFFYFRNIVSSVLGQSGADISLSLRKGKLESGEVLILASDGLSDNLFVEIDDGYVKDGSGCGDLGVLVGKERSPEDMVPSLAAEVGKRVSVGRIERKDRMLVPKEDDLAIIAVRMG